MLSTRLTVATILLTAGLAKAQAPGSWSTQESAPPPSMSEAAEPLSSADQARYAEVGRNIVVALNSEDDAAYRALFSAEGWSSSIDWVQDMFALQSARYGRIARAYTPKRGAIRMGTVAFRGDEGNGATMLLRFEEEIGCAFSFVLDKSNKIAHTSVFLKQELYLTEPDGLDVIYDLNTETEKNKTTGKE